MQLTTCPTPDASAAAATARLEAAVWQHPLASRRGILERLFTVWFNSFVYNQIWEDPRVDLAALELVPGESRLLTISSGGCNVLNYLVEQPAAIAAIDMNRSHISLLRLKLAALEHLPGYEEFFLFFGCGNDAANRRNYDRFLSAQLDEETRTFWEGGSWLRRTLRGRRINYFTKNFYDYAKLGYFLRFLHLIARTQHCNLARILTAQTPEEQETFYREDIQPAFDHWLFRAAERMPIMLFSLGIPPQQFRAMQADADQEGGMTSLLRSRVHRLACNTPIRENYFGWQAFSRSYDRAACRAMPDYLKPENFEALRSTLKRVTTHVTSFHEFLGVQAPGAFDRFVLLDAQDWMRPAQIADLWAEIARVGPPGSRVIFRTAARRSPIEEALPAELYARFEYEESLSRRLHAADRSAIYGGFHVYSLRH
jgi:S-adenosylmethionine-diacylglycerol 3-amino-3-carboxypropyl transferase